MNPAAESSIKVEIWQAGHPRWADLLRAVDAVEQRRWFEFRVGWHRGERVLAALSSGLVAGFLRFVLQEIGTDDDLPPVTLNGQPLIEAKVMAFAVLKPYRQRGIGRALQIAALREAHALGCYQLRSHSSGDHEANHHLKLSLGFAVHPILRGEDRRGVYFVMPLRADFHFKD